MTMPLTLPTQSSTAPGLASMNRLGSLGLGAGDVNSIKATSLATNAAVTTADGNHTVEVISEAPGKEGDTFITQRAGKL